MLARASETSATGAVENPARPRKLDPDPVRVIEALGFGPGYHLGNALTHLVNADHTSPGYVTELKKALQFIGHAVDNFPPVPLSMSEAEFDGILRGWLLHRRLVPVLRHLLQGRWVAAHLLLDAEITRAVCALPAEPPESD